MGCHCRREWGKRRGPTGCYQIITLAVWSQHFRDAMMVCRADCIKNW